jgi:hypothetical protein
MHQTCIGLGFRLEYVTIDLMHVSDLGILQYLLGNIMFEAFKHFGGLVTMPAEGLGSVMAVLRVCARELKVPMPINDLTIGMIKRDSKPVKLKVKVHLPKLCLLLILFQSALQTSRISCCAFWGRSF